MTAGCLCGSIRYKAKAFLEIVYYCHCRSCQKSTGQPAEIGVLIKAGTLTFEGESHIHYRTDYKYQLANNYKKSRNQAKNLYQN